jgi:dihydroxy-acid dehydratase
MPAIVLSGGPMLDGWLQGRRVGSGAIIWHARRLLAAGEIDYQDFMDMAAAAAPSIGHCNTMGTALSMNVLAEALGMSLPGCASIPAPYRERGQMAYETGRRIVGMVWEDLTPSRIMTRAAFENAIVVASAVGASTNCPVHLIAIARHMGVDLDLDDWQTYGHDVPLIVDVQPAGEHLGEDFHRAGGTPSVIHELMKAGRIHEDALTVTGRTIGENNAQAKTAEPSVIRPFHEPLKEEAGFIVMTGNLFDSAIMKTSVIGNVFRARFLETPGRENIFEGAAVVFEGPEDYHARINDPGLHIEEHSILFMRNCGPIGYPGSAEVVNMLPPDSLIKSGVLELPCVGDGRQSGTSASPSILNASPEAAAGGNLALLRTGDPVRIDLKARRVDVLIDADEMDERRKVLAPCPKPPSQTPWQEMYRAMVGQLATGACLEPATVYLNIIELRGNPRHSH